MHTTTFITHTTLLLLSLLLAACGDEGSDNSGDGGTTGGAASNTTGGATGGTTGGTTGTDTGTTGGGGTTGSTTGDTTGGTTGDTTGGTTSMTDLGGITAREVALPDNYVITLAFAEADDGSIIGLGHVEENGDEALAAFTVADDALTITATFDDNSRFGEFKHLEGVWWSYGSNTFKRIDPATQTVEEIGVADDVEWWTVRDGTILAFTSAGVETALLSVTTEGTEVIDESDEVTTQIRPLLSQRAYPDGPFVDGHFCWYRVMPAAQSNTPVCMAPDGTVTAFATPGRYNQTGGIAGDHLVIVDLAAENGATVIYIDPATMAETGRARISSFDEEVQLYPLSDGRLASSSQGKISSLDGEVQGVIFIHDGTEDGVEYALRVVGELTSMAELGDGRTAWFRGELNVNDPTRGDRDPYPGAVVVQTDDNTAPAVLEVSQTSTRLFWVGDRPGYIQVRSGPGSNPVFRGDDGDWIFDDVPNNREAPYLVIPGEQLIIAGGDADEDDDRYADAPFMRTYR